MEKQDVKRMQIVRHLKQQNTATRTTKKRSTTYNTPVRHDSENYQQREIENNSELFPKERPEFSDLDSTSKLSLQQERTNEKYIEPEHPEFYRRIEETSPLEDQLGLVYTDKPQAEPKISYHERDIHNLRLFTQRYILQKEMENFANQAQVQVTSGNVERPQTTGELAGIYENEMRESPSTSQVSRQIETSEMLFSEYTEPAMPDILKRDSFSMQKSYHRNTEDDFTQDNGSNATVWSVSSPKEKIFSPEVSLMHEEQVPAYIPEYKIAEEQTSLQEQRMKNLRLFAQKYAKQIATNQIPSVYLEHQESNSLQMGTPFNINSGVQENFPSREQQEQRAAEDQAEQQRQEILRQNDIYQQTMYRRSEEELFPESERSSVYFAFGEKQNPTLSARKYANAVIGNTISVSANVIVSKSETKIPEDASVSENADSLERFKKAARAKKFQAARKKKTDSTGGIKSPNATSTEQILSSDTTSKQDTVMPLTSSEIDGILESWKKDSFNVLRAKSMQEEISGEASDIFKGEKDFSMKSKERSRRSAQAAFFDRENAKKHSASKVDLRARSTSNSNLLEKNSDIIKSPDELRDSDKIQLMQLRRLRTFLYHGKHEPKISTQSDASITRGVESSSVVQGVSDPSKKNPDVLELQEADLNSEPKSNINRAIQEKPSVAGKKSDVKTEGKSDLPNKDNKMTFHRRNYEEDWSIDEEASSEKKKSKPQEKKKKQPNKKTDSKNQEDKKKASQEAASEKQAKNRKAAEKHGKIVTAVKWLQKGQKTKNSIQVFQDTDKQEEKQKRISEQQKLLLKGGTKAFLQVSKALIQLFFGLLPVLFFGAFFSFLFIVIITQNQSASSEYDGACYLAAKYESGGNPDQTGGDGGIDWSWKKSNQTSASGNAAVQAALNAVGSGYSQTRRDDPGWYDCSSLVYRSYAAAGITYLNGKCAAEQAQYLVSHNMTVSYSELQPGDLIFYSYEVNGRYRNISHVAIYVGDGVMVHAANESRGVVKQALSQSNLSPQLYCRPQ